MTQASHDSLIGRTHELERLRRYVGWVADGSTPTVLIDGEAGIGKTRVLMSLLATARARGLAVFHGAASRAHVIVRRADRGAVRSGAGSRGPG